MGKCERDTGREKGSGQERGELEYVGGRRVYGMANTPRTTTELTTTFATAIANLLGLSNVEKGVEVVVRAVCLSFSPPVYILI